MLASKGGFRLAVKMTRLGKFPESKVAPGDKVYGSPLQNLSSGYEASRLIYPW